MSVFASVSRKEALQAIRRHIQAQCFAVYTCIIALVSLSPDLAKRASYWPRAPGTDRGERRKRCPGPRGRGGAPSVDCPGQCWPQNVRGVQRATGEKLLTSQCASHRENERNIVTAPIVAQPSEPVFIYHISTSDTSERLSGNNAKRRFGVSSVLFESKPSAL